MNHFNFNGKVYKAQTPVIGADSRALRYGDGLFETIKVKMGHLILEDEHFARLWKGMGILQFDIPKQFTPDKLKAEIISLVNKNNHGSGVRIRLSIFRADGGLYDIKSNIPNYIIQSWALPEGNGEWNSNGLVAGIYDEAKKACDILSNVKHNNYLPYILAAFKAKKEKWNDAFVLNTHGRICDSTIANIFIIKNELISTPFLNEGCIAGVMRKNVMQQIAANNLTVVETQITMEELLAADEVFLTNSIYNIRWVKQIENKMYQNNITQKIYALISATI